MSLNPCTECGKPLSSKAESCPACGFVLRRWQKSSIKLLLTLIAGVYGFLQLGSLPSGKDAVPALAYEMLIFLFFAISMVFVNILFAYWKAK